VRKTGQNIKYDSIVLRREGVTLAGIELDTMVLSYLLEPNWGKHQLEKMALTYLQTTKTTYEEVAGKGKKQVTMDQVAVERVAPYACQDADLALRLGSLLWDKVRERKLDKLYATVERPLIEVLADMEIAGVRVDPGVLAELSARFGKELGGLETRIHELAGQEFNINSPKQLAEILFHKLALRSPKKTKVTGSLSTSMEVLEELAPLHPLADLVLKYRTLAKLKSTYADVLPALIDPATGRIHTCYNQTVASTGRLSSSEPNLQNIPVRGEWGPEFRKAFIADDGCGLLTADYAQIELRILAHLSGDKALCASFLADRDIHAETAVQVFGETSGLFPEEQRRRAKVINFSIIYGTSAFSLAKELGTAPGEAQKFIDRYFDRHPQVREYLDRIVEEARVRGTAETLFGRQRQVPELRVADRVTREAGRRIALNMPIQGTAADVIKLAMVRIHGELRKRRLRARMTLQVHDELVFEVPAAERAAVERVVREGMESVCELSVPLKVHLGWGRNWAEAK
jgi:DNA polymerase-1